MPAGVIAKNTPASVNHLQTTRWGVLRFFCHTANGLLSRAAPRFDRMVKLLNARNCARRGGQQSVCKKLSSAPHPEVWILRGWISARGRNQVQRTLLIDSSQPVNRIGAPIILPAFRPAGAL